MPLGFDSAEIISKEYELAACEQSKTSWTHVYRPVGPVFYDRILFEVRR